MPYVPSNIRTLAETQARAAGIPARLVQAVIAVESAGNPYAVSRTGARGLMQLMPATATRYGVINAFDANENVRGGCAYLRDLLQRYHGDAVLATAAYNAGEGAVDAYHGIPPFPETTEYVKRLQASGAF